MGKLITFLLAGLLLHVVYSYRRCSPESRECNEERMTDAILSQAQFPSAFFLRTHCSIFNETVSCLVADAEECANSPNKKVVNEYKTMQSVLDKMCDEGSSFRESYLKSVSCYNGQMDNYRTCSIEVKQEVDGFTASESGAAQPIELRSPFKYQCLKLSMEFNCRIRETAQNCGMEAAYPLRDILHSITNLLIRTLCSDVHMAVWSDEFRKYLVERRDAAVAASEARCQTESNEGSSAVRPEETVPPASPGSHMRDVVLGIIRSTRQKLPQRSPEINEEGK